MHISIVGLGYVGSVTAACFAERGHHVLGVDVSQVKVDQINGCIPPVQEIGLKELLEKHVGAGTLGATTKLAEAWAVSDVLIVSVGTPSGLNGDVDLTYVMAVVEEMGILLTETTAHKTIVITSTIPPGTLSGKIRPRLEDLSGKKAGVDFGLCFSPEFLREGTAIKDFLFPDQVVIGSDDAQSTQRLLTMFGDFHEAPTVTTPEVAETVKFAANAWHALKVVFANEMGRICDDADVDSRAVMDIFKSDTKLNISARYLNPGFSFGGSCLPKDLRTLTYRARSAGVRVPVLDNILASNDEHLAFTLRRIETLKPKRILILGLAFKRDTDDLRESPTVPLVESLLGRGYQVGIYDEEIQFEKLVGANRAYVETRLPHLIDLMYTDLAATRANEPDLVIVTQINPRFVPFLESLPAGVRVLDLCGIAADSPVADSPDYAGITW